MGCGGRDVTLEVFETYLKKLLHMIDKLPSMDKEKAVMILKNSANHYYDLTLGQHTLHTEYFTTPTTNLTPVSCQEQNNFPQASNLLDSTSSPFSPMPETAESPHKTGGDKMESEILAEISHLTGSHHLACLPGDDNTAESESWDQHVATAGGARADTQHVSSSNTRGDLHMAAVNNNTSLVLPDCATPHTQYTNINPRCALCNKLFSCTKDVTDHYLPVSCIGCKKELCNTEIFALHYHSCKGIKHYQTKFRSNPPPPPPSVPTAEATTAATPEKISKKQTYKCEECGKVFITAFQLNKHVKGHNDNNCDKCDAKFAKRRLLVNHLKTVHYISTAEKYYPCKFCPRKFVKKPSLWSHYTEHTIGNQVVCLKCGEILDDAEVLEKHTEEHKSNARHTCNRCGDFFIRKQQYLSHLAGHDKYNCKICGKDFSSKKRLKLHKNVEHDPNNINKPKVEKLLATNKNPNFTCVVCLQNYKNETLFKAHDCSKDGKKGDSISKLKTFAKDVTVKLPSSRFKCQFCDFEHKRSSAVVRHARIHRNKKRFVCEQCGAAFNAHYTLKEHRLYVHSDDRKFSCSKCDKTFKARNALIRHEQVHSDKRPFACQCGQMFKRSSHLKRHMATSHKGETNIVPNENIGVPINDKTWTNDTENVDNTRYKPSSNWDSGNNKFSGIPASVALDVVTSLDLNMKNLEHKEERQEVGKVKYDKDHDREYHPDYSRLGYSQPSHHHHRQYMGHQLDPPSSSSRYYPGPPVVQSSRQQADKEFDLHEKLYLQQHQQNQDKMYVSPPPPPTPASSLDRNYALEDRGGYTHGGHTGPTDPIFSDSGPADLTMTRSSMSRESHYTRSVQQLPNTRPRYSNYSNTSSSSSRGVAPPGVYHAHPYSRQQPSLPSTAGLDPLDDPYISFSGRQPSNSHYFESNMDNYILPSHNRDDIDLSQPQCDKKKLYKTADKYYRGDHQDLNSGAGAGGLLPPLLALAPHNHAGVPSSSPQNIKLDYLCSNQADHLTSQYIQDGTLDYNNMTEY